MHCVYIVLDRITFMQRVANTGVSNRGGPGKLLISTKIQMLASFVVLT